MSDKAKPNDYTEERAQKANDGLDKPADALNARNASKKSVDSALEQNPNKASGMTELAYKDGFVDRPDKRSMELEAIDKHGNSITIDKNSIKTQKDIVLEPTRMTPEAEAAKRQTTHEQSSQSAMLMAMDAEKYPAMKAVALGRQHADSLPSGHPQKQPLTELSRELAATYSPEMRIRYQQFDGGTHRALSPDKPTNTPEDWFGVAQKIAQLPIDKQLQVLGSGLMAGMKQHQHDERERVWGQLIGSVQGTGEVLQGMAQIVDFGAACISRDNERASKMGEEFGKAVGQTIVGGVRLFQAADQYLFNIGYTGDYTKPFRDVVAAGQKLDERWSHLSPREQERIKAKLITEVIESGLIGSGGASAVQKASKFTEVLDALAVETKQLHQAAKPTIKRAVQAINDAVEELIHPIGDTGTGVKMPFPKEPLDETKMLMSKADDTEGNGLKHLDGYSKRKEAPEQMPPHRMKVEIEEAMRSLDQPLLDILKKEKVHIEIVEKMEDAFPGDPIKKRAMGAYDWGRNIIFIPEKVWHGGELIDNFDFDFAIRHEIGHVINAKSLEKPGLYYSRPVRISDKMDGFIEAFQRDLPGVPDDILRKLGFDKTTDGGRSFARDEVFADIYAHATGFHTKNPRSQLIKKYFTNTLKFMQENLHV